MPRFSTSRASVAPIQSIILLFCLVAGFACNSDTRQKALQATFVSVNAARDGFLVWNNPKLDDLGKPLRVELERPTDFPDNKFVYF